MHADSGAASAAETWTYRPKSLFPLTRHVSWRISLWLARTAATANQITIAGSAIGLISVFCFLTDNVELRVIGAIGFFLRGVLFHCDGEVARLTGCTSRFGDLLSEGGGAIVQIALWLGVSIQAAGIFGNPLWFWFGVSAAAGVVINLLVALRLKVAASDPSKSEGDLAFTVTPDTLVDEPRWRDRALFVFRELIPADLWILFGVLGVTGTFWVLLPATAIGVHVYWLAGLQEHASRFHV